MGDLPDSGHRTSFGEGMAVREADPMKPALEGISPFALLRLGVLLAKAGEKYPSYKNWEAGMPVSRYIGAIFRHLVSYMAGDTSEDHLAAILWNAAACAHHEVVGSTSGKTFADLDDRSAWANPGAMKQYRDFMVKMGWLEPEEKP